MKFSLGDRRTVTSVYARDVQVGDTICEKLNRYCETRCVDPVIREEGRVTSAIPYPNDGEVFLSWRTPYGESKNATIGSYQPVMVVR